MFNNFFSFESLFKVIFAGSLLFFVMAGLYLKKIPAVIQEKVVLKTYKVTSQIVLNEPQKKPQPPKQADIEKPPEQKTVIEPELPKEDPVVEKIAQSTEPIDLTKNPVLNQKVDDIKTDNKGANVVRRVYGLRKVYSTGFGAGGTGTAADAIVNKIGNTLSKEYDTITATKSDIKGEVVSVTTITSSPRLITVVKPEYTKEMIDNKIEGIIQVKVLVDIDGRVKQAIGINDLGSGSKDIAVQACLEMRFEPAMRGTQPVAVWIMVPIRFVMLG